MQANANDQEGKRDQHSSESPGARAFLQPLHQNTDELGVEADRIWSTFGLPAVLVACGLPYLAEGWATLHRIYGPDAGANAAAAAHAEEPTVLVALGDEP